MDFPKVIFLDFDGVICESCGIKNDAYYNSYIKFGHEIAQKALDYHLLHGGISRVKLFPELHKMFLGREITEEEHVKMCENFTLMVEKAVVEAPLVNGVETFLKEYHSKTLFFVSSGTPEDEMRRIVEKKQLSRYFKAVFGSPDTKETHILNVLKEYEISPQNALFVGDATTDRDAAKNTGIRFLARLSPDRLLEDEKFKIEDFNSIVDTISKM